MKVLGDEQAVKSRLLGKPCVFDKDLGLKLLMPAKVNETQRSS